MDTSRILHVGLLGGFRLILDGEPVKRLDQARLQFLLAYLLLHRDAPISRQQLAFTFWPDTGDDQARSNLRTLLHRLRDALPDSGCYLHFDRHTVLWHPDAALSLDVVDFEAALDRAQQAQRAADRDIERRALQEAAEIYTGDLLPACYDDWIGPFRERLSLAALRVVERLTLLQEEVGDYRAAIASAQRLLHADPLREVTYRYLMRLHALSGDRTGVVRAFNTCTSVLRRELGASPDVETRAAYATALKQTVASASSRPLNPPIPSSIGGNLPPELSHFVGRDDALAYVRQLIAAHRLVTLTGSGGVGKTRLALRIAADLRPEFPDGAWWVDLGPVADEALVTPTVASAIGVREGTGHSTTQDLARQLGDKRLLLVLDNCEHLAGCVGRLAPDLLHTAPHLRILVTSQQSLGIAGELAWRVPSLSTPVMLAPIGQSAKRVENSADALSKYESVRLFVERAQASLPSFALTVGNFAAIAQICRRLNGIPLAIELAATRIRTMTPDQIAARLDDAFSLLARQTPAGPTRQQTLWAALEWSHDLLGLQERVCFRRLAVFAGSFTLEAAEAICSGDGIKPEQMVALLAGLEDKSLVESEPLYGQMRFRMHEIPRQYSQAKLLKAGETERLRARHLDHYAHWIMDAASRLTEVQSAEWLDTLEAEHDNLRSALAYSQANRAAAEIGLQIVGGLARFWATRGYFKEGRHWARTLLSASDPARPTCGRLQALRTAGNLAYYQADYAEARTFYEQALATAHILGDKLAVTTIVRGLGTVAHEQADCERALTCYRESLALCQEIGDRQGEATARANLGLATWQHGDSVAGRDHLEASLALRRELGDEIGIAYVLHLLADIAWSTGQQAEAQSLNEESLRMRRRLGDRWGIAYSLDSLAVIAIRQRDGARARALFAESLMLFDELGSQYGLSDTLDHLAGLLADEGSLASAAQLMAAAAALRETIGAALPPNVRTEHERQIAQIRDHLGDERFRTAWTLGRALTIERAVRYALELTAL